MSQVSALQKLAVAARIARDQAGRSRTLNAALSGFRTTARSFARALHHLWLEVTGTVFLAMAMFGAVTLVREYLHHETGHASGRLAIAVCFTVTFAWFGVSSFWRVRRKSQRP